MLSDFPPQIVKALAQFEYLEFALSTGLWAVHAKRLRESSELLWAPIQRSFDTLARAATAGTAAKDDSTYDGTASYHAFAYLLVAGAALETMLKAAAIQRALNTGGSGAVLTPDGTQLQDWLTTHNLKALAEKAGLTLGAADELQMERFTDFIMWAGRYPTRKKFKLPSDEPSMNYMVGSLDRPFFDRFFQLASDAFDNAQQEASVRTDRR